ARVTESLGLSQVGFAASQFLSQELVVCDVHPRTDKLLDHPRVSRRAADATDATNFSIRPHDPFREFESSTFCQHLPNRLPDELAIVEMDELHILFKRWRLAARIKTVNSEQLWRPVVESSGVEGPATRMRKALS